MAKRIITTELNEALKETAQVLKVISKDWDDLLDDIQKASKLLSENKKGLVLTDAKDIQKVSKLLDESNELVKLKNEADKESQKIKKQLISLTDEEVKGKIRFQQAQREQKKLLQAELTLQKGQARTLTELRERTKALKIARDQLDFEGEADQIRAYNDEIDANTEILKGNSDAQAQLKFNIGNYREEVSEAIKDNLGLAESFGVFAPVLTRLVSLLGILEKKQTDSAEAAKKNTTALGGLRKGLLTVGKAVALSGIGALIASIGFLVAQFRSSKQGSILFASAAKKAFTTVKIIGGFVIDFLTQKFKSWGASISNAFLSIKKLILEVKNFVDSSKETATELENIRKKIAENNKTIAETDKELNKLSARNLTEEIGKASDAVDELVLSQFNLKEATQKANIEIAKQQALEEKLLAIADDDTRSFNERAKARERLLNIINSGNSATIRAQKLAELQLKINRDAVAVELRALGVSDQRIKTLLQAESLTKALIQNQSILEQLDTTALDQLAEAEVNLIERTSEVTQQRLERTQTLNKVLFDEVEQQVDFLIDGNEQIKMSNEKLINDETKNLALRRSLLEETQRLIAESNRKVQDELARTVEGVSGSDINQAFEEALSVEDLNSRLKALGLAEIPINRLLELFREIQTQTRDFADASKVITEAEKKAVELRAELNAQTDFLNNDQIKSTEDLNDALEVLANDRFNNEFDRLTKELELAEDGSTKKLEIQQKINDLLIKAREERIKKEEKLRKEQEEKDKKAAEKRAEQAKFLRDTFTEVTEQAINGFIKQSQKEQQTIQESIDGAKQRQQDLLNIAQTGDSQASQLAAESLAKERELERERTIELEKEKKKQARLETIIAGLKAYSANAGQPNAEVKTIAEVGALLTSLSNVGSFFVGADRLSADGRGIDSKGGMLNINHPDEMIIQGSLNKEMGFPKREHVVDVFKMFKNGDLVPNAPSQNIIVNKEKHDNKEVIDALEKVNKSVKSIKQEPPKFNDLKRAFEYSSRTGNRVNKHIYYVK